MKNMELHERINRRAELATSLQDTLAYRLHVVNGMRWRDARREAERITRQKDIGRRINKAHAGVYALSVFPALALKMKYPQAHAAAVEKLREMT